MPSPVPTEKKVFNSSLRTSSAVVCPLSTTGCLEASNLPQRYLEFCRTFLWRGDHGGNDIVGIDQERKTDHTPYAN